MTEAADEHLADRVDALERCVIERISALLPAARAYCHGHARTLPAFDVRFDLRGQSAGQAVWPAGKTPRLRFNLALGAGRPEDFVTVTVAHELAHLVTAACHRRARPHGAEWKAVMRALGIADPRRCHDYPVPADATRQLRRWPYACGCRGHALSTTRHRRAERGNTVYRCRHCDEPLRFCPDSGGPT